MKELEVSKGLVTGETRETILFNRKQLLEAVREEIAFREDKHKVTDNIEIETNMKGLNVVRNMETGEELAIPERDYKELEQVIK